MRAENFSSRMPLFGTLEKTYPSQLFLSFSITVYCSSAKQEQRLVHDLAAQVSGKLVPEEDETADAENGHLSYMQNIVLGLLSEGLPCRAIGEKLFIGTATVQGHKKIIYKKLHVHSRGELLKKFPGDKPQDSLPY